MDLSKEYRDVMYVLYRFLHVLCLFNVSVAQKCLQSEGHVVELCRDSAVQTQHAVMLDTSLFSPGKGSCICRFNVTGDYLDISHLEFPEQCGSKIDFHLGSTKSTSESQSIDCTTYKTEFNTTVVKDGSLVLSQLETGAVVAGFCVSMETDPNAIISVQCDALPEASTGSIKKESLASADTMFSPISIKDMFQDRSTGASNAIQELLSKSGISPDSIFLEPNLIQTPVNSLQLMDRLVTPAMIGEEVTTESTPLNFSAIENVTESDVTPSTFPALVTEQNPSNTSINSSVVSTSEQTSSQTNIIPSTVSSLSTQDKSTHIDDSTSSISPSKVLKKLPTTTSLQTSTTVPITASHHQDAIIASNAAIKSTFIPSHSISPTTAQTGEHILSSLTGTEISTITLSSSTSFSTTVTTDNTTPLRMEESALFDEKTVNTIYPTAVYTETSTASSAPEIIAQFEVSKAISTVSSTDITSPVLSSTILGVSTSESKSESSTTGSDLTTSVLSSTPTSSPLIPFQTGMFLPSEIGTKSETPSSTLEETVTPSRKLAQISQDGITGSNMLKSSITEHEILSSTESSSTMYSSSLPDLNELYSEELQQMSSFAVSALQSKIAKITPISRQTDVAMSTITPEKEKTTAATTLEVTVTTEEPITSEIVETTTTERLTTVETSTIETVAKSSTSANEPTETTDDPSMRITDTTKSTTLQVTKDVPSPTTIKSMTTASKPTLGTATFKPTKESVEPVISRQTTSIPASEDPSTKQLTVVPSVKPRGDLQPRTAKPMIVKKPVMTRLPPIIIPIDSPKETSLKPSFKPGQNDKSKDVGSEKPPADLSTVDDSEHLDDDTITVIVVGSVIGVLVFIAIVVILATFLKSRRKVNKQPEEKDDIEMNGGTKGIDNPLLQLEEEESAANGSAVFTNGKANGVVEESPSESGKAEVTAEKAEVTAEKAEVTVENAEDETEKAGKSSDDIQ